MMGIDPVKPPSSRDGNPIQRFVNHYGIGGPNQPGDFLAILQKDQGWPELHAERPAKRTAFAILDFNMAYFGMPGKNRCDQWLSGSAITAPRCAEFDDTGTFEKINFGARRLRNRITRVHAYFIAQGVHGRLSDGNCTSVQLSTSVRWIKYVVKKSTCKN